MIESNDYAIRIDYDEAGLLVVVHHKPSGETSSARPATGASVEVVKQELIEQFERKFYPWEDFERNHYQIAQDGKRGGSWDVRHLPTGIVRGVNTFDNPELLKRGQGKIFQQLMREVVAEIWRRK